MGNVQFGFASPHFVNMTYRDDSGIPTEEWAAMSEEEQNRALVDWVFGGGHLDLFADEEA